MFPKMRRQAQQLSPEQCRQILLNGSSGILSMMGENGYPYGVPLSYVYHEGKLIFHGATQGHKFRALQSCNKASFCVIAKDEVVAEQYTTHFASVIAFGKVRMLTEFNEEMIALMMPLAQKYHPHGNDQGHHRAIENEKDGLCVFVMEIEHLTGKAAKELI